MIAPAKKTKSQRDDANTLFTSLLPSILLQLTHALRRLEAETQEEAVAECIANCYLAVVRLIERDKSDMIYSTPLARYAVKQYFSGRRVGSKLNSKELYSRHEQGKGDASVRHIGSPREQRLGGWREMLCSTHRMTPSDLAAFRIDFPRWLGSLSARNRAVAEDLAMGERTQDVASKAGISPARVSQLRRELEESWQEFVGELEPAA